MTIRTGISSPDSNSNEVRPNRSFFARLATFLVLLFVFGGSLLGTLTMVKLFDVVVGMNAKVWLRELLDEYNGWINYFAMQLEPIIESVLAYMQVPVELDEMWRYLLILMLLYCLRDSHVNFAHIGYTKAAIIAPIWGLFTSLLASASVGGVRNVFEPSKFVEFLTAAIPTIGLFFYLVGATIIVSLTHMTGIREFRRDPDLTRRSFIVGNSKRNFWNLCVALALAAVVTLTPVMSELLPGISQSGNTGLFTFALIVFMLGIWWLFRSIVHGLRNTEVPNSVLSVMTWLGKLYRNTRVSGNFALGTSMLAVFLMAAFVALLGT